ncbi:MAG: TolB family protein, partial [Raineya sp.]
MLSTSVRNLLGQKPAEILKQPANIVLSKQYRLNSSYREVNMNITPDGKYMFFMSSRGQMPWSRANYLTYKGQAQYDGDIWYSERVGKTWQMPKCLGENINTNMGEDEPNISPDGNTVYFQSWHNDHKGNSWLTDGGPYYKASRIGTNWGQKVGLGGGIHQFFKEFQYGTDGMTLSPDGKIFIVAAGADYDGAMDLFISYFQNGSWTYPRKLPISTSGDERSPFIAADGETLYFASDGYKGFGGLDIYKVSLAEARTASNPKVFNLGAP